MKKIKIIQTQNYFNELILKNRNLEIFPNTFMMIFDWIVFNYQNMNKITII